MIPAHPFTPLGVLLLFLGVFGLAADASAADWLDEGDSSPDGWVATDILEHAEFVRITFESGNETTAVELTLRPGSEAIVQPGPGASPPAALLDWVSDQWRSRPESAAGEVGPLSTTPQAPVWVALIAIFLLTVVRARPPDRWPERRELLVGGAVALGAFAYLSVALPDVPLIGDTCRDLQLARDCLLGLCGSGARAGFAGLQQGTLWLRFLAALLTVGISVATIPTVLNLLHAIVIGLAAFLFAKRFGWIGGVGAGLSTLVALSQFESLGYLWNPTLVPLASVLAAAAAVNAIRSEDWRDFALLGVTVWLVAEAHVIGWSLLPAATALAGARAKRAFVAAPALLAASLLCHLAVSPDAAATNMRVAGAYLIGASVVSAAIATLLRRFDFVSEDRAMLAFGVAFALTAPVSLVVFGELRLRYAAPGFGFMLWSLRAYLPQRLAAVLPAGAAVAFAVSPPMLGDSPLVMASETPVLEELALCGAYDECLWSLHASPRFPFVRMLDATDVTSEHSAPALAFVPAPSAPEGSDWSWVPSRGGGFAVRGYEPWVHRRDVEVCPVSGDCVRLRPEPLPSMHYMRTGGLVSPRNGYGTPVRFEFPIRVPRHQLGESRELALWAPLNASCRVVVTDVIGLEFEGELPNAAVVLNATSDSGRLVVEIGEECRSEYEASVPTWVEAPSITAEIRSAIGR